MIDILSVLLGYLLGTFLTGALCVFLLGWTGGRLDQLDQLEKRLEELRDLEEPDSRSKHL